MTAAAQQGVNAAGGRQSAIGRCLPASECTRLRAGAAGFAKGPWPVEAGNRARASGAALSVAIGLLESSSIPKQGSRIMTFVVGHHNWQRQNRQPQQEGGIRGHTDLPRAGPSAQACSGVLHQPEQPCHGYSQRSRRLRVVLTRPLPWKCATYGTDRWHDCAGRQVQPICVPGIPTKDVRENPDTAEGLGARMGFGANIEVISREVKMAELLAQCLNGEEEPPSSRDGNWGGWHDTMVYGQYRPIGHHVLL